MLFLIFTLFACITLACDSNPFLHPDLALDVESAFSVIQAHHDSEPIISVAFIMKMIVRAHTPDVLRILLDEIKDFPEVKNVFAERTATLSFYNPLYFELEEVKLHLNRLLKHNRIDLLKVFVEYGLVNDECFCFNSSMLALEPILFLFEHKLNMKEASRYAFRHMSLPTATSEDLKVLHQSGFSLDHVEYDDYNKSVLECLLEVRNLEAAHYAHHNGARLPRFRLVSRFFESFTFQPEDLSSYIIVKDFTEKAVLFLLSKNDEGSLFGQIPGELNSGHLAPALVAVIHHNTFLDLFLPS